MRAKRRNKRRRKRKWRKCHICKKQYKRKRSQVIEVCSEDCRLVADAKCRLKSPDLNQNMDALPLASGWTTKINVDPNANSSSGEFTVSDSANPIPTGSAIVPYCQEG